jgi:hypothetical protein
VECLVFDLGIDKVDIGFVDEQHAAEGPREFVAFGCRDKRARWCVRICQDRARSRE